MNEAFSADDEAETSPHHHQVIVRGNRQLQTVDPSITNLDNHLQHLILFLAAGGGEILLQI